MIEGRIESEGANSEHRTALGVEERALLERITTSRRFRRAMRLRDLLFYIGQHSNSNGSVHPSECEIGFAVFERPRNYDTSTDNIVRVNASELRRRLEEYFSEEGAGEPVIVEMPRGSYNLHFRPRDESQGELPDSVPEEQIAMVAPQLSDEKEALTDFVSPVRIAILWPIVSCLLLIVCGGLLWQIVHLRQENSPWRAGKALRIFWSEFFDKGQEVDIVLADTSFALTEDIEHRSISLARYLNYDYKHLDGYAGLSADRQEDLQSVFDRNNGSVGDFIVAERILDLDRSNQVLHLSFARDYSSEAIKTHSIILIGSRESNPWVELFEGRMNFSMEYDPILHRSTVHNRQPGAGEQGDYVGGGNLSQGQGLSVVAFVPGLNRFSSALIIEGTDSQATRAAGEFVTSDEALEGFLAHINSKRIPYFEVLLASSQVSGTPLHSRIIAFRVHPRTGKNDVESGRTE
jgi:hypothetical protein